MIGGTHHLAMMRPCVSVVDVNWGHQRQELGLVVCRTTEGGHDVMTRALSHLVLLDAVVMRQHLRVSVVQVPDVARLVFSVGRVSPHIGDGLGETLGIDATLREVVDDGIALLLRDADTAHIGPDCVQFRPLVHRLLQDSGDECGRHIRGMTHGHRQVLSERGHTIKADQADSTNADGRFARAIERVASDDTQRNRVTLGGLCGAGIELVLDVRPRTPAGDDGITLARLKAKAVEALLDGVGECGVLDDAVTLRCDTDDDAIVGTLVAPSVSGLAVSRVERDRLDRVFVGVRTRSDLLAVGASDLRLALVLLAD